MANIIVTVTVEQKDVDRIVSKFRKLGYKPTIEKQDETDICPICGGELELDLEYMQNTYGEGYIYVPKNIWVFWCPECEEAGTLKEIRGAKKYHE